MKKTLIVLGLLALCAGPAFAATFDTVQVNAEITEGTSSVTIAEATLNFGSHAGTAADHRFSAGPMTVSYFAAAPAWTIRAYTDNSSGGGAEPEKAGLKGLDGTTFIPLKLWNANYGPDATMPDPENDLYWVGTTTPLVDPVWLRIPEKDEQTPDPFTWRRLCGNGTELDAAGFENYLAIDVQSVKAQTYSTTLTVEIIHQ